MSLSFLEAHGVHDLDISLDRLGCNCTDSAPESALWRNLSDSMSLLSWFKTREMISSFYCPVCRRGYGDKVSLAIHIRKWH